MLIWEQYDSDTWGLEWGEYLALVKLAEKTYTAIVGTVDEALWVGYGDELKELTHRCNRAMIVLYNDADISRVSI
jgi:hypothetical protein